MIISVIVLTVIALSLFANQANQVEYETLFRGLTNEEAGKVLAELEAQGIDVISGPDGTLMVPKGEATRLRYTLQAEGIPGSSTLDYNLYSENASSFGATDQDKQYYERAQLQQNISATINQMDKIKSSTVLLAIAEESPYVLSGSEPDVSSASILVNLNSTDSQLTQGDVDAIRAIVSRAVPSLSEENIAIVDQYMHSYGLSTAEDEVGATQVDAQIALQKRVSDQLAQQIVNLLTPVFGAENLTASVNVILDFDKSTVNSLTLSPPTNDAENMGIITSMKLTAERLQGADVVAEGEPGMDPNGGSPTYQEIDEAAQDSTYYNAVTEVNAEVNEVSEQIENAQGDIVELSATLIINGGEELEDILPEVRQQIATAIGVSEDRITVSAMPFEQNTLLAQALADQQEQAQAAQRLEMVQTLLVPLIVVGAIVATALIILLQIRKKRREEQEEAERIAFEEEQAELARQAAEHQVDITVDDEMDLAGILEEKDNDMLQQIRDLVGDAPESIAQLLKNWLSDDFGRNM